MEWPEFSIPGRTRPPPPTEEAAPIIPTPDLESPFWRDTSLDLHLRSSYLERNRDGGPDSLAWALGGWLAYRSDLWWDRLSTTTATRPSTPSLRRPPMPGIWPSGWACVCPVNSPIKINY